MRHHLLALSIVTALSAFADQNLSCELVEKRNVTGTREINPLQLFTFDDPLHFSTPHQYALATANCTMNGIVDRCVQFFHCKSAQGSRKQTTFFSNRKALQRCHKAISMGQNSIEAGCLWERNGQQHKHSSYWCADIICSEDAKPESIRIRKKTQMNPSETNETIAWPTF